MSLLLLFLAAKGKFSPGCIKLLSEVISVKKKKKKKKSTFQPVLLMSKKELLEFFIFKWPGRCPQEASVEPAVLQLTIRVC